MDAEKFGKNADQNNSEYGLFLGSFNLYSSAFEWSLVFLFRDGF